jgi:hypothetical protein
MFLVFHLEKKMFDITASQNHTTGTVTFSWKPATITESIKNQIEGEIYLLFAVSNEDSYYPLEWVPAIKAKHTIFHKKPGQSTIKILPFWMKSDECPYTFDDESLFEQNQEGEYPNLYQGIQNQHSLFLRSPISTIIPAHRRSELMKSLDSVVHYDFKFQIIRKEFARLNRVSKWIINTAEIRKPIDQCDGKIKTVQGIIWIVFSPFFWLFVYTIAYTISIVIHSLVVIHALLLGVNPRKINFKNVFTLWGSRSVDDVIRYPWYDSSFRESPWLVPYFWVALTYMVAFVQSLIVTDPRWIITNLLVTSIGWIVAYLITKLSERRISTRSTQEVIQIDPSLQMAKDYLDGKKVSTPVTLIAQVWYESAKSKVCKRYLN